LNTNANTLRTIVEDESFSNAFAKLKVSYRRLDEVLVGITLALVQSPEHCPIVPGTVLSILKTREFPGIPPLRIFFTYDEKEVHLRHVELIQSAIELAAEADADAEGNG
jgi:hypothetical protein